ncbi:uncharacterized protein LOC144771445 [Lissotriton helveticus]
MNVEVEPWQCSYCAFGAETLAETTEGGNALRLALINCRSLRKHRYEIFDLLLEDQTDVLFLTETWLDIDSTPEILEALPNGYGIVRIDRGAGRGGIAIIYKHGINCSLVPANITDGEAGLFTISLATNYVVKGLLIYRPPGPHLHFTPSLIDYFIQPAIRFEKLLVLGDMNLHLDDALSSGAQELCQELEVLQIILKSELPTHKLGHLLDPIFANWDALGIEPPLPVLWSDHFLTPFWIKLPIVKTQEGDKAGIKRRKWAGFSQGAFDLALLREGPPSGLDVNEVCKSLKRRITAALDCTAPWSSKVSTNRRKTAPWFSEELRCAKTICKQLERRWRKAFSVHLKADYKLSFTHYHSLIRKAKAAYFNERIQTAENSTKEMLKIFTEISSLASAAAPYISSEESCNRVAEYFADKVLLFLSQFSSRWEKSGNGGSGCG